MAAALSHPFLIGAAMPPNENDQGRPPAYRQLTELAEAFVLERRLLEARVSRLTAIVEEYGVRLPPEDPRVATSEHDHLKACARVVYCAYGVLMGELEQDELEEAMQALRTIAGSSLELLQPAWRKP